jgi:hypothetical protein
VPDGRLRFRIYVEGELVAEDWLVTGDPEGTAAKAREHGHICDEAKEAGKDWLLEVYDPDRPEDDPDAYLKIGPDSLAVMEPIAVVVLGVPSIDRRDRGLN